MFYTRHQTEALEELVIKKKADLDLSLPAPNERRALRTQLGLTQAEVADVLFIHPDTFGRWERGDARPGPNSLKENVVESPWRSCFTRCRKRPSSLISA